MPSPFPGMNPYLEGPEIWEDFHADLATKIRAQLAPQIQPDYVAVLTPSITYEEVAVEQVRRVKPDVGVIQADHQSTSRSAVAIAPAPLTGQVALEVPVRSQSIEIRRVQDGVLVTAIELLSPVNKRHGHEAFHKYRLKRRDLLRAGVHLLEIDLLRGGSRPPLVTPLPDAPYFVFLSRAERYPNVDIWPVSLQEPIPILPTPLVEPDPDVPLDLNRAIQVVYDEAFYHLRIDYAQPPPLPALSPDDATWLDTHLQAAGART